MSSEKMTDTAAAEPMAATVESPVPAEVLAPQTVVIGRTVVVAVYEGALETMKRFFASVPDGVDVKFIQLQDNETTLLHQLALALSDESVPKEFVLVPAGTIPCGGVDMDALVLSTVYEDRAGKRHYDSGLPLFVRKDDALAVMEEVAEINGDAAASEEFAKRYIEACRPRPVVVSFNFGNYVTPVKRANPCEHVIIEALVRKKFLTSTPEGFRAMVPVLEKTFKDE